uniref:Uncharacterized protein n=1 Tax=Cucumis melo TaxID=3656 RepID=A0A9I9DSN1_CUCME
MARLMNNSPTTSRHSQQLRRVWHSQGHAANHSCGIGQDHAASHAREATWQRAKGHATCTIEEKAENWEEWKGKVGSGQFGSLYSKKEKEIRASNLQWRISLWDRRESSSGGEMNGGSIPCLPISSVMPPLASASPSLLSASTLSASKFTTGSILPRLLTTTIPMHPPPPINSYR